MESPNNHIVNPPLQFGIDSILKRNTGDTPKVTPDYLLIQQKSFDNLTTWQRMLLQNHTSVNQSSDSRTSSESPPHKNDKQIRRTGHPYSSRTPARHKKPRTSFARDQLGQLETRFHSQKYLASSERAALAEALQMTDAQVKTWFQNRRTKWRRQVAEEREEERRATRMYETRHYIVRPDISY